MSDRCPHDLSEQDTYIADGYCPLCLLDLVQTKDAEIERLRADRDLQCELKHNAWDRADKLQAVVDAAKAIYDAWPEHIPHPLTELGEALAALEEADDE